MGPNGKYEDFEEQELEALDEQINALFDAPIEVEVDLPVMGVWPEESEEHRRELRRTYNRNWMRQWRATHIKEAKAASKRDRAAKRERRKLERLWDSDEHQQR